MSGRDAVLELMRQPRGAHPPNTGGAPRDEDAGYGTPGYGWGRPRMNSANPAAFRRAARRVTSFARAAQKMLNLKPRARRKANPFKRRRK
jgi:hypothetical protein